MQQSGSYQAGADIANARAYESAIGRTGSALGDIGSAIASSAKQSSYGYNSPYNNPTQYGTIY